MKLTPSQTKTLQRLTDEAHRKAAMFHDKPMTFTISELSRQTVELRGSNLDTDGGLKWHESSRLMQVFIGTRGRAVISNATDKLYR